MLNQNNLSELDSSAHFEVKVHVKDDSLTELLSLVLQLCGSDGHAVCCHSDDVYSVEQSVQQPSAQAFGEELYRRVTSFVSCLQVAVTPCARRFAPGLLGCAAGASDSDRRHPAVPEEAGAA